MSHRKVPIPFEHGPEETCKWCGEAIVHGRVKVRRWHDGRKDEPNCLRGYNLVSNHDSFRSHCRDIGRHHCWTCGAGRSPSLRGPRVPYAYSDRSTYSHLLHEIALAGPRDALWGKKVWDDIHEAARGSRFAPTWKGGFEVDHRRALIDGGPHAVENLQLLCLACHKAKTSLEAWARAEARRMDRALDVPAPAQGTLFG